MMVRTRGFANGWVVGCFAALNGWNAPLALAGPYPKVNLAVGYKVDPSWPRKPANIPWRFVTGVCVDKSDRVWVVNQQNPPVQVYSTEGEFLFSWGDNQFKYPHHVHVDRDGNVWIADFRTHTVREFTPKGELLLTLGTPDAPGEDEKHLNGPTAAVTSPSGDVFVSDGYGNNRVVHFDANGRFVKAWGRLGQAAGELSQPHAIAIDSRGRLYVAERNNCRIQIFDQQGKSLDQWRNLINPWSIWITPDDQVLVCGSTPARWGPAGNLGNPPHDAIVMKFNTDGRALELWSFPLVRDAKMEPGCIDWVHGIAADSKGDLYLSDVADESPAHRVQKFIRLPAER